MKSFVSIFEIPAVDITRAVNFYGSILDIKIELVDIPDMKMGLFPIENHTTFGVIIEGDEQTPSAQGVTVYLNGGNDLQIVLDRVEKNGGKIVASKAPLADESGFFALFIDSEGNRLGLHSKN
ncbi:MAG: VOC family protein [Bdellovibrionota bacterium]|nr:VOC family protein [Bdellovibrionota bacterium]